MPSAPRPSLNLGCRGETSGRENADDANSCRECGTSLPALEAGVMSPGSGFLCAHCCGLPHQTVRLLGLLASGEG